MHTQRSNEDSIHSSRKDPGPIEGTGSDGVVKLYSLTRIRKVVVGSCTVGKNTSITAITVGECGHVFGARNNVRGESAINSDQNVVIRTGTAPPLVCFSRAARRGGSIGGRANLHLARPRWRSPGIRHRSQARYHPRPSSHRALRVLSSLNPPTPHTSFADRH